MAKEKAKERKRDTSLGPSERISGIWPSLGLLHILEMGLLRIGDPGSWVQLWFFVPTNNVARSSCFFQEKLDL